jgi:hypothetical protein
VTEEASGCFAQTSSAFRYNRSLEQATLHARLPAAVMTSRVGPASRVLGSRPGAVLVDLRLRTNNQISFCSLPNPFGITYFPPAVDPGSGDLVRCAVVTGTIRFLGMRRTVTLNHADGGQIGVGLYHGF